MKQPTRDETLAVEFRELVQADREERDDANWLTICHSNNICPPWVRYMAESQKQVPLQKIKAWARRGWLESRLTSMDPNGVFRTEYLVTQAGEEVAGV